MNENANRKLEYNRSRYREAEQGSDREDACRLSEQDRQLIREFDDEIRRDTNKGTTRHSQLLDYIITSARHRESPPKGNQAHGLSLKRLLEDPDAADIFLDWLEDRTHTKNEEELPLSNKTKEHYRGTIRAFADLICDDGMPPHIEGIQATTKNKNHDPTPHPKSILFWDEHVIPILDHSSVNVRDKAIVATAWDTGARPWELHNATPYLRRWLREHPIHDVIEDGEQIPNDTPVWSHLNEPKRLGRHFERVTKYAGDRANISRPTNMRQFRKSRASVLAAAPEVGEHDLRIRFGWEYGSNSPAHYKARFDDAADQHVANADGANIKIEEEHADPAPVKCPQCEKWTPRHLSDCFWCDTDIILEETEDATTKVLDTDVERVKRRNKRAELLGEVGQGEIEPEVLDRVLPFADVIDEDPDIIDDARKFLDMREQADD